VEEVEVHREQSQVLELQMVLLILAVAVVEKDFLEEVVLVVAVQE
jgi:hypothetical protein